MRQLSAFLLLGGLVALAALGASLAAVRLGPSTNRAITGVVNAPGPPKGWKTIWFNGLVISVPEGWAAVRGGVFDPCGAPTPTMFIWPASGAFTSCPAGPSRLARLVGHSIDECFALDTTTPTVSRGAAGPYGRQPLGKLLAAIATTVSQTAVTVGAGQVFVRRVLWGETRPSLELAALLARAAGRPIAQCFSQEMLGLAARIVHSDR